jgi:hypothetical protein
MLGELIYTGLVNCYRCTVIPNRVGGVGIARHELLPFPSWIVNALIINPNATKMTWKSNENVGRTSPPRPVNNLRTSSTPPKLRWAGYQSTQTPQKERLQRTVGGRRAAGEESIPTFQVTPQLHWHQLVEQIGLALAPRCLSPISFIAFFSLPESELVRVAGGSGRKRGRRRGAHLRRRPARHSGALGVPPPREFLIYSFSSAPSFLVSAQFLGIGKQRLRLVPTPGGGSAWSRPERYRPLWGVSEP